MNDYLYKFIEIRKAIKDEVKLRKLYIKETDERLLAIQNRCRGSLFIIYYIITTISIIISSYFNDVIGKMFVGCLLSLAFKKMILYMIYQ